MILQGNSIVIRVLPLLGVLALAGCYSAENDILPDYALVAPYTTIAYVDKADELHVRHTLTRSANGYVEIADDGAVVQRMRLMAVKPDWYVVELTSGDGDDVLPNYGYVHFDAAAGEAQVYASEGDEGDLFEGSHMCGSDICIDDLDAYLKHADAKVADGAPTSAYYVDVTN